MLDGSPAPSPSASRYQAMEAHTANGCGCDVPPFGGALNTVTCAVPAVARSAASIWTRSSVGETNVVGREPPFHSTSDPETKPVPITVTVRPDPPEAAPPG